MIFIRFVHVHQVAQIETDMQTRCMFNSGQYCELRRICYRTHAFVRIHGIPASRPENACSKCKEIPFNSRPLLASTKTKHQMESALLLDVVITQGAPILQLLTSKDQSLLVRWDTLLVLNLGLDVVNGIG